VQELLTLYVVERWLARLSASPHAGQFVLKGGMLLGAYDARRPTADLDALARSVANDQDVIVSLVEESLASSEIPRLKAATSRKIVAGAALALGGLLLIIATRWGHFG
jgi:hypothetical protein